MRASAQRGAGLLCVLVLIGSLLNGCGSPQPSSPLSETITNAGRTSSAAPVGDNTAARTPTSAVVPSPAASSGVSVPSPTPSTVPQPTATATAASTQATVSAGELAAKLDALVATAPAHVAVEVGLADGTMLYQHNAEDLYDAASLYKLGIMVQVYKDRDNGTLTFDDPVTLYPGFFYESDGVYSADTDAYAAVPVGELLRNMITLSSNVAAEALLNLVGTDEVNQTMANLGLTNTRILWSPVAGRSPDGQTTMALVNPAHSALLVPIISRSTKSPLRILPESSADSAYDLTTAADMASLFKQLLAGSVLNQAASAEMLDLLTEQQITNRLPAALPAGTKVAHKTGDLDGLLHDAGVIYGPSGPIVVVVLTDEITDHDAIIDLFHQIALLAYDYAP